MKFTVISECPVTKARVAKMELPHHVVDTPVFMPVGTQGTLKGMTPKQLESMDCQIMLGNAYHLGNRPGPSLLEAVGGLHKFMGWNRSLLTDGVQFQSPHDNSTMLLTPEHSIELQNSIGADIIMQLDDVVHVLTKGPRVEEAMWRSVRWLDRSIAAHKRPDQQNLFAIIQGGLDLELRGKCIDAMVSRGTPGYAIGGLSGGEDKQQFWRTVDHCTNLLPQDKPRYLMGVGYPVDLVVCCALGVDMYDCVYPTRTARFGTALVPWGQLQLKNKSYSTDFTPIDPNCLCTTCVKYSRSLIHSLLCLHEPLACDLVTLHNIHYQLNLMKELRKSIEEKRFPQFIEHFMCTMYPTRDYPQWSIDALKTVKIVL